MNKIGNILTVFVLMLTTHTAFSQLYGNDDNDTSLTTQHENVSQHASALGTANTQEENEKHIIGASQNLIDAGVTNNQMEKSTPEKYKAAVKPHHAAIRQHHANATKHVAAIKKELTKTSPNDALVKEHIRQLNESINGAKKEHQAIVQKKSK